MQFCTPFLIAILPLFQCAHLSAQQVQHAGEARLVMQGIDLSSKVQVDSLAIEPHLYALGPMHDLQGEITVLNSEVWVSQLRDGEVQLYNEPAAKAPFLVYAYVKEWKVYPLELKVSGMKHLESQIDSLGKLHGIAEGVAFPFKIEAQWDSLHYHIIMRDTLENVHSHAAHDKAKVHFEIFRMPGTLLGFFSRKHEGVFTHKGQALHVHFISGDRKAMGHLDWLGHIGAANIYLPVRQ